MTENRDEGIRDIPAFNNDLGKREISTEGKSLLEIVNASLEEYRESIKTELARLELRIVALEKQ